MPIGKDSITKRVAKQTPANDIATEKLTPPTDESIAPELVATVGVAPAKKAPAKKAVEKLVPKEKFASVQLGVEMPYYLL